MATASDIKQFFENAGKHIRDNAETYAGTIAGGTVGGMVGNIIDDDSYFNTILGVGLGAVGGGALGAGIKSVGENPDKINPPDPRDEKLRDPNSMWNRAKQEGDKRLFTWLGRLRTAGEGTALIWAPFASNKNGLNVPLNLYNAVRLPSLSKVTKDVATTSPTTEVKEMLERHPLFSERYKPSLANEGFKAFFTREMKPFTKAGRRDIALTVEDVASKLLAGVKDKKAKKVLASNLAFSKPTDSEKAQIYRDLVRTGKVTANSTNSEEAINTMLKHIKEQRSRGFTAKASPYVYRGAQVAALADLLHSALDVWKTPKQTVENK